MICSSKSEGVEERLNLQSDRSWHAMVEHGGDFTLEELLIEARRDRG